MNFEKDIANFAKDFNDGCEKAVRGTTVKLWESIVKASPVDEGRFRANWNAGNKPSEKTTTKTDKSGSATIAKATQSVLKQPDYSAFYLSNNLPYADVIENGGYPKSVKKGTYNKKLKKYDVRSAGGFSKQAPQGVVRVNVKRFNSLLAKEAKKSLPK